MLTALVVVFVIAYAAIALEHPLKVNKSASALVGAGVLWTIYAMSTGDHHKGRPRTGRIADGHGADRLLPDGRDDHCRSGRCAQRL
jgi:Na+/H+ antiporter NhaD/arsenite permease-like protein